MTRIASFGVVVAVAVVALGAAAGAAAAGGDTAAARGKRLYHAVGCVHCHGTEGQGSSAGARLAPDPLPAAAIAQFIRATNTTMPAYTAKVLGDADVADIAAFLATIPPARPADSIPALRELAAPKR